MIPTGPHTDWPWPFSLIPRRWTAVPSDTPPFTIGYEKDVPPPGRWVIALSKYGFMFSFQTKGGWLFRIGTASKYYELFTLTLKKEPNGKR
jgi:hypothetical protein